MANSEFVKQFDKLKEESKERWDKMTNEEKAQMKERSRRFVQKSKLIIPNIIHSEKD